MIRDLLRYSLIFIALVAVQVLILNNIQLSGYINPYLYILFIMVLPLQIQGYLLLLLSFLLGLSVDMFSNTAGIHASASVFAGFLRPFILNLISSRENLEKAETPGIRSQGFVWFLKYTIIVVIVHHFWLFFAESFTFVGFFHTLLRIILSCIFTIILILTTQYIAFKN